MNGHEKPVEPWTQPSTAILYRLPGVGFVRSGAQRYELDSALGSNLDTRDQSGANTGLTEYDAYGREVYQDVFVDRGDFRFGGAHGYANDDATGWQQLGARLYVPGIGRFLTQDPLGQEGGLNLYAYCDNSPLMATDAAGTQADFNSMFNSYMGAPSMAGLQGAARGAAHQALDPLYDLTNFTSLFDPTPLSDLVNAGACYSMGDNFGGHLSMVGALFPFASGIEIKTSTKLVEYAILGERQAAHVTGSLAGGKSQFLYRLNADELTIMAARHADANGLWRGSKATVEFSENIGVHGSSGQLTRRLNVYRRQGRSVTHIHGSPGSPR